MLSDVGMVKTYIQSIYLLKLVNVARVVTKSQSAPPCSWTFSASWFFHVATCGFRDTMHHPYIFNFMGNIFTPLVSVRFMGYMLHIVQARATCKFALSISYSYEHMSKSNYTWHPMR